MLGRYLGPAIDIGTVVTAKTMKVNGEVLHWSTYRGLKEYEWKNQAQIYLRKEFDSNIKYRFGTDVSPDGFLIYIWRIHPCTRCMRITPQM